MTSPNCKIRPVAWRAFRIALLLPMLSCLAGTAGSARAVNLALNKPATASSIENDEHSAAQANDGDPDTCWRADDEPEGGAEWLQVDLEKPTDLSGCQIRWPFRGRNYCFKVEGSADRKSWRMLSDQTNTTAKSQIRNLKFENAQQIRYVKVTVTRFEEGCWASISEVKVFGLP